MNNLENKKEYDNKTKIQNRITSLLNEIDELEKNKDNITRQIEKKTIRLEKYFKEKQIINGQNDRNKKDEKSANRNAHRIIYKLQAEHKEVNMTNAKIALIKIEEEKGPLYPNYESIMEELYFLIDEE